ncbi:hypothetical protein SDRG_00302 [Saprolegnia diclina VS20]|uniref:Protein kinase domain-containing protein n=1 Tax=Saprolegnia diclina (strain VS20) TaxID=1156394 RepID=T0SI96_SAPDV|nr:hypothetical protein SDRG_00302 [Saprolegnia diclina VS20]EQC42572.1 hypothetical protein SDRG_00302 [Saprolegnia diclina VS20]|eukprot:XP_008603995.1 hypothetical protein SDRG_00302 [Saprolegnia diclina VS20]
MVAELVARLREPPPSWASGKSPTRRKGDHKKPAISPPATWWLSKPCGLRTSTIHGCHFTVSYLLLATEYCYHGDLFDYNEVNKPLPSRTIRKFTGQIAANLGALHAAGVMHRDIEPENIYVDGIST